MLVEKSLTDADIKKMIDTLLKKTAGKTDDGSKSINKMVYDMAGVDYDELSQAQVGYLMKTTAALSGK